MDIYIFKKDVIRRGIINHIINNIIFIENFDMSITLSSHNPLHILRKVSERQNIGVYFIEGSPIGIDLACKIRELDTLGVIVFLNTDNVLLPLILNSNIEALTNISNLDSARFDSKIRSCLIKSNIKFNLKKTSFKGIFTLSLPDSLFNIKLDDILYFETSTTKNKIKISTKEKTVEFSSSLKDIEPKLDSRFFRPHKSFIINLDYIQNIYFEKRIIQMKNNYEIPLSCRKISELKTTLKVKKG